MTDDATAALERFNAHVDQLADEAGIEIDAAERQRIFGQSVAAGFNPEATVEAFEGFVEEEYDAFEDDDEEELGPGAQRLVNDFQHDVGKLEERLKRPLSDREHEHLVKAGAGQASRHGNLDLDGAHQEYTDQFATTQSREAFFDRRMKEQQPEVEVDYEREYDLSDQGDRHAYFEARMNGGEPEDGGGEE